MQLDVQNFEVKEGPKSLFISASGIKGKLVTFQLAPGTTLDEASDLARRMQGSITAIAIDSYSPFVFLDSKGTDTKQ